MAKAKKLPSGNWRVRVYSHTTPDGKKHYESFTASTKQEAEMMAAKFANDNDRKRADDLTVKEAVQNYIESNKSTLSPSTIYGYIVDAKRLECIDNIRIRKITSKDIQGMITELVNKGLSPKTVKNTYGLLRSSLTFYGIEQRFMIHLPSIAKKPAYAPENEQIATLYNNASPKMKTAIMLAAFHSLRRGEICGLKYKDLKGNTLYIHSDMVRGADGKSWIHKEVPKTDSSNRIVYLSKNDLELIGTGNPEEYIVPYKPSGLSSGFKRLKARTGVDIRFHDLRVYFASISVAMNIPETITAHHGGWKENSTVLKKHYQKPIESIDKGYAEKLNSYFKEIV